MSVRNNWVEIRNGRNNSKCWYLFHSWAKLPKRKEAWSRDRWSNNSFSVRVTSLEEKGKTNGTNDSPIELFTERGPIRRARWQLTEASRLPDLFSHDRSLVRLHREISLNPCLLWATAVVCPFSPSFRKGARNLPDVAIFVSRGRDPLKPR